MTIINHASFHQYLAEARAANFSGWDFGWLENRMVQQDNGAVLYYLKAIPWQVEGFSLGTHFDGFVRVHNIIEHQGKFVTTAHQFIIMARKKEATL